MNIAFVELAGFRGFKDKVRFDFPPGFAILTGPNGVGKSTAMDAIDFALTGTINKYAVKEAKGGGLESHTWWVGEGAPDQQYVSVGFRDDEGQVLVVTRSREQGLHADLDKIGSRLCLGSAYGSDWALTLMQTSLIRDETIAALSLDLPEQARFAAVRSAIGGLHGPDHSKRTNTVLSAANSTKEEQEKKLSAAEAELGRALGAVTEARSLAERHADVSQAESIIKALAAEIPLSSANRAEALRRLVAERKRSIPILLDALSRSERLLADRRYFDSEAGRNELRAARTAIDKAREELVRAEADLAAAETVLNAQRQYDSFAGHMIALLAHGEAIGLQDGHCPLCAAERTAEQFDQSITTARARLRERADGAVDAASALDRSRKIADEARANVKKAEDRLRELEARRDRLQSELESIAEIYGSWRIEASASDHGRARDLILKYQEDNARLEQALLILESSGAHHRVTALQTRVDQLRTLLDEELARLSTAERAVESARQIDNAAKAVANQVLAEQFDTVMPLLKELYLRLRPHTDWREIEIDFGGRVRASLNFTVGDGKNPQFLFSSGQRRAAGLAFLLSIHLSRPWCGLQTLLLDDPIQHIDDYRALNLVEVLSAIRRTGRQIIVAVEDPALADVLCRRLRSTPLQPGRRFDLVTQPNGSAGINAQTDVAALPRSTMELAEAS